MSITYSTFGGDRIALIVRGKTSADHDPSVMAQHADCALSNGAPIGYFGEPAGGGSSDRLPSSIGGSGRSGMGSTNLSGMSRVGAVYDYRALRRECEADVELGAAQGSNTVSTALLIATKLLVHVDTIKKTSTGLFGLGNSPSVAGYQPDPHTMRGQVISGPTGMAGRKFTLELPGYKAKALTAGAQAALGLVAERSKGLDVVVCVAPAPEGAAATQWLADWHRPTD